MHNSQAMLGVTKYSDNATQHRAKEIVAFSEVFQQKIFELEYVYKA